MAATPVKADFFISQLGLDRSWVYLFYESVFLARALTLTCYKESPATAIRQHEETLEFPRTCGLEKASECYLNKLAYLCSNTPGSGDITAVALLRDPEKIFYVLGSNNRTSQGLEETVQFIRSLFQILNVEDVVLNTQEQQLTGHLMNKILLFHRDRIKVYLNRLATDLAKAIDMDKNHPISMQLSRVHPFVTRAQDALGTLTKFDPCPAKHLQLDKTTRKYTIRMQILFPMLEMIKRRISTFRDQSQRHGASYSWESTLDEIMHFIGRLLSYRTAPAIFLAARHSWPEIFADDVELVPVSSSTRMPNPFPQKRRNSPAKDLIIRLFPNAMERDISLEQAEHFQGMTNSGLYIEVRRQFDSSSFRPCIHCEVLVHDWIIRRAGGNPTADMFFFRRKYIGVGKPTCQLCWSYLSSHNSGVGVRPSHGNLYPAWRMPNSYAAVDSEAEQERIRVLHRVRDDMRQLCKRTLGDSRARRKNRDSETSSSRPTVWNSFLNAPSLHGTGGIISDPQDLASSMQRIGLEGIDLMRRPDDGRFGAAIKTAGVPQLMNVDIDWAGDEFDDNLIETASFGNGSSASRRSTASVGSVDDTGGSGSTSGTDVSDSLSRIKNHGRGKDVMTEKPHDETEDDSDGGGVILYTGRGGKSPVRGRERGCWQLA